MPPKTRTWTEPLVTKVIKRHRGIDPEEILERHAEQLRHDAEQNALPIDVNLIASVQGVRRRLETWDFAGRIYADVDGQLVMDLNADDGDERQRFTCAHELMHLAFPGFKKETRYRLDTKQPGLNGRNAEEEYLCDLGAAALLMPRSLIAPSYEINEGLSGVERLAHDAEVSLQAAGNRLISLSTVPAAFLVFECSNKPADRPAMRRGEAVPKRLRLRYATLSRIEAYLPKFKSASEDSAFGRAWHEPRRARGRELLPGAEQLGAFDIEAKAYGGAERRVVLATALASGPA